MELVAAVGVFAAGYLVNMFFITVLYHRGLTHSALELSPALTRIVGRWGVWCTGLEPKAWACMHRLHHQFSASPSAHSAARGSSARATSSACSVTRCRAGS